MALLHEWHELIEFDFDVHGWDLLDFWRGIVSARKTQVRIKYLPATSEFKKAFREDVAADAMWGPIGFLVADLIDMFGYANFEAWQRYPRPADRLAERQAQAAIMSALQEQAERNKLREAVG